MSNISRFFICAFFKYSFDSLSHIKYYKKLVADGAEMVGEADLTYTIGGGLFLSFPLIGGICLFVGIGSVIAESTMRGCYQKKINDASKHIKEKTAPIN